MTEFERIKAMDVVEFALYLNKMQNKAIEDYQNGYFPKGAFANVGMLKREVTESLDDKIMAAGRSAADEKSTGETIGKESFAER